MEWVNAAVAGIDQAAFTRADLIEALGAAMPVTITDTPHGPRWVAETLADAVGMRITAERARMSAKAMTGSPRHRSSPKNKHSTN